MFASELSFRLLVIFFKKADCPVAFAFFKVMKQKVLIRIVKGIGISLKKI